MCLCSYAQGGKPCRIFVFCPFDCLFSSWLRGETLQKFSPLALLNASLLSCPRGETLQSFSSLPHLIVSFSYDLGGKPCRIFDFFFLIVSIPHDFRGKILQKFSPLALLNASLLPGPRGETLQSFSSLSHLIVSFPNDLGGKPCRIFDFFPFDCFFSSWLRGETLQKFHL